MKLGSDKRKALEKKKKIKKVSRSSSESDDDRKHKKKRKSSTTSDASSKETKKRKSGKGEVNETAIDVLIKDDGEDVTGKKSRHSSRTDVRSIADPESENDIDDNVSVGTRKALKGTEDLIFFKLLSLSEISNFRANDSFTCRYGSS